MIGKLVIILKAFIHVDYRPYSKTARVHGSTRAATEQFPGRRRSPVQKERRSANRANNEICNGD